MIFSAGTEIQADFQSYMTSCTYKIILYVCTLFYWQNDCWIRVFIGFFFFFFYDNRHIFNCIKISTRKVRLVFGIDEADLHLVVQLFKRTTACFYPSLTFLHTWPWLREWCESYSTLLGLGIYVGPMRVFTTAGLRSLPLKTVGPVVLGCVSSACAVLNSESLVPLDFGRLVTL